MSFFPLNTHSHFSLLRGLSKPDQIVDRIAEAGYEGTALTDCGTLAGVPSLIKEAKKKKLKVIAGCSFLVSPKDSTIQEKENGVLFPVTILAKGQEGWKNLIKACSEANKPENFFDKRPRLDLARLAAFGKGEWVVSSGQPGSELANCLFNDPKKAYEIQDYQEARGAVATDWRQRVHDTVSKYLTAFGRENFYLAIELIDSQNVPAALVVAKTLRWVGEKMGVPCVATASSFYPRKEDAADQRILLCTSLGTTLKQVEQKLERQEEFGAAAFFRSNRYYIPSFDELKDLHTPEELGNTLAIAARCETPTIFSKPLLPTFDCPGGITPDSRFKALCAEGWNNKISGKIVKDKLPAYAKQIKHELEVLTGAGLSSYFLIKHDIIAYARNVLKCLVGEGRGSAAGCMASYLTGVTDVDPLEFDLLFERFYSYGRNSPSCVSFDELPFETFKP